MIKRFPLIIPKDGKNRTDKDYKELAMRPRQEDGFYAAYIIPLQKTYFPVSLKENGRVWHSSEFAGGNIPDDLVYTSGYEAYVGDGSGFEYRKTF